MVSFTNQSSYAGSFRWDFGDGTTSSETNPRHSYTEAGSHTVTLEAWAGAAESGESRTVKLDDPIGVLPGPLASLSLHPERLVVEPTDSIDVTFDAQDAFGNAIQQLNLSWSALPSAGSTTASGHFTATRQAGTYRNAIDLEAEFGGASVLASADVEVMVGPLHSIALTAEPSQIYTGEQATLRLTTFDQFGNTTLPTTVDWSSSSGTVTGDTTGAIVTTSREPGNALVEARAGDSRGQETAAVSIAIDQGFCATHRRRTIWQANWWETTSTGKRGQFLGTSTWGDNFDSNWGTGEIVGGRRDNVQMEATSEIVIRRRGPVLF